MYLDSPLELTCKKIWPVILSFPQGAWEISRGKNRVPSVLGENFPTDTCFKNPVPRKSLEGLFPIVYPVLGSKREIDSRFDKQGSSQKETMGTFSTFNQALMPEHGRKWWRDQKWIKLKKTKGAFQRCDSTVEAQGYTKVLERIKSLKL